MTPREPEYDADQRQREDALVADELARMEQAYETWVDADPSAVEPLYHRRSLQTIERYRAWVWLDAFGVTVGVSWYPHGVPPPDARVAVLAVTHDETAGELSEMMGGAAHSLGVERVSTPRPLRHERQPNRRATLSGVSGSSRCARPSFVITRPCGVRLSRPFCRR